MIWVLLALNLAFEIWMIIDCLRNRRNGWLFAVIFLPFAAWIYFVIYKLPEMTERDMAAAGTAPVASSVPTPSRSELGELERNASEIPSLANHLAFAAALDAARRPEDAIEAYDRALAVDEDDKEALYGIARARLEVDDAESAVAPLERLVELDATYADHEGWSHLALALRKNGQMDEAIDRLRDLVERSPRMVHRLLLARYLLDAERPHDAAEQLEAALDEHEEAPVYLKRQDAKRAKLATEMLGEASRRME